MVSIFFFLFLFFFILLSLSHTLSNSLCRILSPGTYTTLYIFSVKLTLLMQIIGFTIRIFSSFLWIQIYRLGLSCVVDTAPTPREADFDLRNSFLSPTTPTPAVLRQTSDSSDVLGGSIYDPAYYSSLFEEGQVRTLPLTFMLFFFTCLSLCFSLFVFNYTMPSSHFVCIIIANQNEAYHGNFKLNR